MKEQRDEILKNYKAEVSTFKKIWDIVYDLWSNFTTYNAWELSERQYKLAWYKFFLSDFVSELNRLSEVFKLKIKEYKAKEWQSAIKSVIEKNWKVSNKEQIENILVEQTSELTATQLEYENLYLKYKIKLNAVDDILVAVAQRVKLLQWEQKYG